MRNHMRLMVTGLLIMALFLQAACTRNNNIDKQNTNQISKGNMLRSLDFSPNDTRIPLKTQGENQYFPVQDLINVIGYQSEWSPETQTLNIGDIDVFYKISINSTRAEKEEEEIQLSGNPIMINGKPYAPVSVLTDLFQQDIHYKVEGQELIVHATSTEQFTMDEMESEVAPVNGGEPFFQDDPEDPFRGEDPNPDANDTKVSDQGVWKSIEEGESIPTALKNIDVNALIRTSKRYLGVPYKFGAKPYPISKKFDCSTYTQYVFGKYGIRLTRVSRNQAKQGIYVSRNSLRKGDLVFFSVPGRFKSDKTVGHVGIYIGNGQMINTFSNKKGVHITDVNKGYWSRKFLTARRIAY